MRSLTKMAFIAGVVAAGLFASAGSATITYLPIPLPFKAAINSKNGGNCVAFLSKDMGIRFTKSVNSWADKKAIKNVVGTPRYGDVAIIQVPTGEWSSYGHLAMVTSVTSTSITIVEAHFVKETVSMRQATGKNLADAENQLRIYGYYRP